MKMLAASWIAAPQGRLAMTSVGRGHGKEWMKVFWFFFLKKNCFFKPLRARLRLLVFLDLDVDGLR
jgi:hypothetical protein